MNIGIIGSGNIGGTLGTLWAKAEHQVWFSLADMDESAKEDDYETSEKPA